MSTEGSPLPLSYTVCHLAVSNLDHLLSVVRNKERPALPENLGKTTAQKLFMLYLVKIVGMKSYNYLTYEARFPADVFGNEPARLYQKDGWLHGLLWVITLLPA